jgi:hypothetical protein
LYARSGRQRGSAPCPTSLSAVITS